MRWNPIHVRESLLHPLEPTARRPERRCITLLVVLGLASLALGACGGKPSRDASLSAPTLSGSAARQASSPERPAAARLLFAGDVMLGRGVADLVRTRPESLFAGIRDDVRSADLALANLESPLTSRPHDPARGPNALEADPASAGILAETGFDAMAIANNHAGDAGPETVSDTVSALASEGLEVIGGGATATEAFRPRIFERGGLRIALLSFDATRQGPRAGTGRPGVAWWDGARARDAVYAAKEIADVVVVGLHGGAEYVPVTDPYLMRLGTLLASWGVDVVWGTGPHVAQPVHVIDPDGDGRATVVATSLGNLVFDQHVPGTREGRLLEVLAGPDGVRVFRVGTTDHSDGPVLFRGWEPPDEGAAALDGAWWTTARSPSVQPVEQATAPESFRGDVVSAVIGDPNGDGQDDLVVAFRRPFARTAVNALIPEHELVDAEGRSAHLGLYRPSDLRPRWVAGTLLRPVAGIASCDGSLAVAYSSLDHSTIVGTGAWRWGGFGFIPLPDLPGSGVPACADVDGDGRLDPLVLERSVR